MSDTVKLALIISSALLLLCGGLAASCNYQAELDAHAPVVETCIKHPATRSPFRGLQ